ncbi:MAG: SH3 domain-containing protein [Actinomycetes bacterium]
MRRVVARIAHEIPNRAPLRIAPGDEVTVGERDSEWPEFVLVTASGRTGWVPARHLSQPSGRAVVTTAYDTTELPTRVGEVLDVVTEDLVSGWIWCRSGSGREGWVPVKTVETGG